MEEKGIIVSREVSDWLLWTPHPTWPQADRREMMDRIKRSIIESYGSFSTWSKDLLTRYYTERQKLLRSTPELLERDYMRWRHEYPLHIADP